MNERGVPGDASWRKPKRQMPARESGGGEASKRLPEKIIEKLVEGDRTEKDQTVIEIPNAFVEVRTALLERFPADEIDDIDTTRVEGFIERQGLEVKPYILFARDELPEIKEIEGSTKLLRNQFDRGAVGQYVPEIDMVVLMRQEDLERVNGALYTEGVLAHELAHASNRFRNLRTTTPFPFYIPRSGFSLPQDSKGWGWFLEEGYADMMRAQYVSENITDEQKQRMESVLGNITMDHILHLQNSSGSMPLLAKYTYLQPDGNITTHPCAIAGTGLELLVKKEPRLVEALQSGRGSVAGLRQVAQLLNSIQPGLYFKLQKSTYTQDDFSKKLIYITDEVFGGIENVIHEG